MSNARDRNRPCWCGSGKKYKKCHLILEHETPPTEGELIATYRRAFSWRTCLHPSSTASCSRQSIQAHTIQRNASLRAIAEDGHVYQIKGDIATLIKTSGKLAVEKVGIGRASTFSGFCASHDDELFAPLEKVPFTGSIEQCFLLAYRCLCRELYMKQAALVTVAEQRDLDRGRSRDEQMELQAENFLMEIGNSSGLNDLLHHKGVFDRALTSRSLNDIRFLLIKFGTRPDFVCSGGIAPDYDFSGAQLQDLMDLDKLMDFMSYALLAGENSGVFVFAWLKHGFACQRLAESLLSEPRDRLASAVLRFVFSSTDNVFFSISWWDALPRAQQDALLARMMISAHPYLPVPEDHLRADGLRLIDWPVAEIITRFDDGDPVSILPDFYEPQVVKPPDAEQ